MQRDAADERECPDFLDFVVRMLGLLTGMLISDTTVRDAVDSYDGTRPRSTAPRLSK